MRVFKQPRESKNCAASPCWYATDARTNVLVVIELRRCLQRSGVAFARPLLPLERGRKSWPAFDNRQIVNGILWRIRTGTPWRDLPEKYGNRREKSYRFMSFCFCVLSLEYPQALSSSLWSDCNQQRHGRAFLEHAY